MNVIANPPARKRNLGLIYTITGINLKNILSGKNIYIYTQWKKSRQQVTLYDYYVI